VGNWLLVHGRTLAEPVRAGQVVEVPHPDGSPPYLVHWLDDDRLSLVFPGSDAVVLSTAPSRGVAGRSAHHGADRR
jgi:hypothetical protein